jgi:hypothetical protein
MTDLVHTWSGTLRNALGIAAVVVVSLFWVFESRSEINQLSQQHAADIQRLETDIAHQKALVEANRNHDRELITQIFDRLDTIIEKIDKLEDERSE